MAIISTAPLPQVSSYSTQNHKIIYMISAIAALGGLLFGFDLVIISGTVPFFTKYFALSEAGTGWAVGCINIGAALGAVAAGTLSDILGRKKLLLICSFLFALTGVATGWSTNFTFFISARFMSGIAVGIASLVCPVYIAEIAPGSIRGRLVTFYQLAIVSGILIAYLSNYLLLDSGINNWRWMFSSQTLPALLFLSGLFFVPESPRWLIKKKKHDQASAVLIRLVGSNHAEDESKIIQQSFSSEIKGKLSDLLKPDVIHIVFLGAMVAIFSQADGQNSLFSYAPVIFKQAGMADNTAFAQSVIIGLVNFVFTFVAIKFIDRLGRKKLLLIGSALLCLDALCLAYSFYASLPGYVALIFVVSFIAIYASTLGPVTWVLLSEIFPNRVRGHAMGLATLSLWIANFLTTASFPILKQNFGLSGTFIVHAGICLLYFFFVKFKVPETKGKTLEEIERQLVDRELST